MPTATRAIPSRNADQLEAGIVGLYPNLGSWPPRFEGEEQREEVYVSWADLLLDALACTSGSMPEERRLAILSELYRLGHNLDVVGAAELADLRVQECLRLSPRSIHCNYSAAFFLLSVEPVPERLDRVEASLETLRKEFAPEVDERTEAAFVKLYVYRLDNVAAQRQIDYYLAHFPDTAKASYLRRMRDSLDKPIETRSLKSSGGF